MEYQRTINIIVIILAVVVVVLSIIVFKHMTTTIVNLEGFEVDKADLEAIRNVSSLYNTGSMKISNLEVTGNIKTNSLNVADTAFIGNNVRMYGAPNAGDKLQILPDSTKGEYYFVNSGGTFGYWTGKSIPISMNKDGSLVTNTATVNGLFTAKNGSRFNGGRHWFEDEEKAGLLRVGAAWGMPGIYAEGNKNLAVGAGSGIVMANPSQHVLTTGVDIVLTNRGTDNHIAQAPNGYLGLCNDFNCANKWGVGVAMLANEKARGKMRIEKY